MSARGPGGRIPPQNRGAQTPGQGKNSKRHDLERRNVPFLHDSDLQQGDVEAMRQGQRVAPVQTQKPAQAQAPSKSTAPPAGVDGSGVPSNIMDVISGRIGGSMAQQPPAGQTDPRLANRQQAWVQLLQKIGSQPGASPLLKARLQTVIARMQETPAVKPRGGVVRLNQVDAALENLGDL